MKSVLKYLINFYRLVISSVTPPCCRFYPSCSEYALQAIETHGVLQGSILSIRRLARCHPFNHGGYDPVPETREKISDEVAV